MITIQRYLLYLAVVLMPFQDTILGKSFLGYFGANVSSLPLLAHALLAITVWSANGKMRAPKWALIFFCYALALSGIYVFVWGPTSHGFSVIYKTVAEGIVLFLWIYTIFYIDINITRGLRVSTYAAFFIMILGVLACDLSLPGLSAIGSSSLLHITESFEPDRWRSLSMEPSTFSATVVSLGAACMYLAKNRYTRIFYATASLLLLIASGSKGALLVIGASVLILLLLKRPPFLRLVAYLLSSGVFAVGMVLLVMAQLNGVQLYQSTGTFATRLSLALWAFIVVLHNPWGVGLSGFYHAMTLYLPQAMDIVSRVSPVPLNFMEVSQYVHGTDAPLDTKCFFLEYFASFGIPFLIGYLWFAREATLRILRTRDNLILVAFIFLILGFTTYVNGLTLYAAFFFTNLAYHNPKLYGPSATSTSGRAGRVTILS